jgi:uncharacterized protein (DUF885 family)
MSQISEDAVRLALASAREQLTAEITEAIERAVREERTAVAAWLREQANSTTADVLRARDLDAADLIERGEHRCEVIDETR